MCRIGFWRQWNELYLAGYASPLGKKAPETAQTVQTYEMEGPPGTRSLLSKLRNIYGGLRRLK